MVGRGSLNGLSPIIRIGKGAIMKTVQAWLRETNATEIIDTYLVEYPIDFPMLEDKKRTVAEVLEAAKENLGRLIQYLSTMEADYSEDGIFLLSTFVKISFRRCGQISPCRTRSA